MFATLITRFAQATHRMRGSTDAPVRRLLFLREFLLDPASVGALCASSQRLAACMAGQVDPTRAGWVIELGAGTGAVTAALLEGGVAPERLIVIERSSDLVRHLRRRFPGIRVLLADAADGPALLPATLPVAAVVSGLPLRSMPEAQVRRVTQAWSEALAADGRLIQFTYSPRRASAWTEAGLKPVARHTVWGNLPPARVQVFAPAAATA